jgi:putative ABC transport system permease protein
MVLTLISVAMAIPVSIVLVNRFLERYAERITGYWWIFVSAALLAVIVSLFAVFWQTLKAARTNPAIELKKE